MFKPLLLLTLLVVCCLNFGVVLAQTSNHETEPRVGTGNDQNSLAVAGEPNRAAISAEASAEAKRFYKEAVKYGRAGLFKQAAQLFQRAVNLKPDFADAYYGLGHAYSDLGQWEEAIPPLQKALELNPKDKEARARLDHAEIMSKREARSDDKAANAKPEPQQASGIPVALNVTPARVDAPTKNATANEMGLTRVYRVGPGDVLDVRLNDSAPVKSTLFTINPSGLLVHPNLSDPLPVAGLTVDEIGARLEADLRRRALSENPKVSVGVRDYVSHTILVSGLVKDPGTKILRREAIPLYVVVADAQPLPEAARVTLVRSENNDVHVIDLSEPGDMNLLVHPGDVITLLPNVTQFFYVGGEVKSPGEKTFHRGLTLTQAIIAAGGVTARSREARLARDDGKGFLVVSRYKLKDIDSGKLPDPLIEPGDRITIVN